MNNFVSIDYETATPFRHSICQVAIVTVINGKIVNKFQSLVKPENNKYSGRNISIHGINPKQTINAPDYRTVFNDYLLPEFEKVSKLNDTGEPYIVAHNAGFDRSVFNKALEYYRLNEIGIIEHGLKATWNCTHQLYKGKGFEKTKLNILCDHFGIPLRHHDASSDTLACTVLYLKHLKDIENNTRLSFKEIINL